MVLHPPLSKPIAVLTIAGSDSGGGNLIIIVVLVVVILMLLSGIGGYLVSTRRGKVSAVAVAEAAQGGGLTTERWASRRATPRIEPAAAPLESPRRAYDAESPRAPPVRQGRLPPLNRGPPRRAATQDAAKRPDAANP